ncbi:hypothetical protein AZO1586I_2404 [Bathymodiolus thermophilus thioautotrophic gill symbiont]|jgi:cellulose biosynthesis protein BcsQ|uniref:ParA family protein n=2 Tax=sulfur-oxidizing symbionts TaxID=32036 RepID=A0A1H6JRX8_9GAMM|nr:hypothetical protein [Bathymodiolus thermophilus thioautotrophic gill symbiont]CAC9538393.1 hypothetical protein [uncultured Gammaproteobacteria bacterium]SEH65259.1 conserved hypothetical protein [Bathymodiolus azoricus thioautotrophic gill symbiont]CAB5508129.1 hypothetical protein AZO1586I_2404 [Bathymodiolus thermophilus thioautotrophic gill symbiont]CAC9557207.1 hypothetical protein [uncultured Gammaproteobacteria bacterium]VVH56687.1 hypothetical protein BAZOLSSOX_1461 [uncultured Gam
MKIAIYSSKGSAGKTPIATNIALDKDFCIGTNELFHVYDNFIPDNQLIALDTEDEFPDVGDIDIVFDLAGSISKSAHSITSALKMSDYVIVPIYNEFKCLVAGLNTISQILEYNNNIIVVATKLQKTKKDILMAHGSNDWHNGEDYKNIKLAVSEKISSDIPVMPLKFSKAFDNIFEHKKSIKQLMDESPLAKYNYKEVAKQFDDIYKLIGV